MKKNLEDSPHLQQYSKYFKNIGNKAISFSRVLNNHSRKEKYIKQKINPKIHDGQRKLLLSEIEFFINEHKKFDKNKKKIVLYIGASTGIRSVHTYTLITLFPEFEYHLYDSSDFFPLLKELKNVKIFKRWFTEKDIPKYKNGNVFLISDIRNPIIGVFKKQKDFRKMNEVVLEDMNLQKFFYEQINPKSALLKFRLPWDDEKIQYLDGEIYFQVWQGFDSTETRLVPNGKLKKYNNRAYEERMFYFNKKTRTKYYKHNIKCYGHCYDCMSELTILSKYMKLKNITGDVCELGQAITKNLSYYSSKNILPKNFSKFDI